MLDTVVGAWAESLMAYETTPAPASHRWGLRPDERGEDSGDGRQGAWPRREQQRLPSLHTAGHARTCPRSPARRIPLDGVPSEHGARIRLALPRRGGRPDRSD